MAVSGAKKRTGARKFTAADRLLAPAPLLDHNRPRNIGRYMAPPSAPGARPVTFTDVVCAIAAEHQVRPTTIFRWLARYRRGGYAALQDRHRRDKGRPRRWDFLMICCLIKEESHTPWSAWRELRGRYGAGQLACSRTLSRWAKLLSAAVPGSGVLR